MYENLTTLEEVAAAKLELRKRLEAASAAEEFDKLQNEVEELEKRESAIKAEAATAEKRNRLMQKLGSGEATGNPVANPVARSATPEAKTAEDILASNEYRSAFAKTLMRRKLNESEARALSTITTTATDFTAAGEETEGVNNGGIAIPTSLNLSLLKALELRSPIFRDINKTSFAGVLEFPYAKTKNKAKRYGASKETTENDDASAEFATLKLSTAEISATLPVTWKLEKMSVEQFMDYLLTELTNQVARSKIDGAIYGSGDDDMKGVAVAAIQKTYSGTVLEAIEANIGALTAEKKIGAKLYISTAAAESLQFAKNKDGDYIFPLAGGLPKSLAGYALEVDPYLNSGDILFGNLMQYARLNVVETMTISKDVIGKKRRNEYTAYEVDGSNAQPDSLLYIKKTTAKGAGSSDK